MSPWPIEVEMDWTLASIVAALMAWAWTMGFSTARWLESRRRLKLRGESLIVTAIRQRARK